MSYKLTLSWASGDPQPDSWNIHLARNGAVLNYEGTVIEPLYIANNLQSNDRVAIGVQAVVSISGRKHFSDMKVLNFDIDDGVVSNPMEPQGFSSSIVEV